MRSVSEIGATTTVGFDGRASNTSAVLPPACTLVPVSAPIAAFTAPSAAAFASALANEDAFALDSLLREAMRALRGVEPRIGRLLRILVDLRFHRALGFAAVEDYVRERLGLSPRKAWALLKLEKSMRRIAPLADAYERGRLTWVQALTLLPVLDRENVGEWLARANTVTVRRLTDEVNWVLATRDVLGPAAPLGPPRLDDALLWPLPRAPLAASTDARCRKLSLGAVLQIGALSPAEVCDAEIHFIGPASVVALFRDALDAFTRAGEPRWTALERPLTGVVAEWEAQPPHRDPIFARDGWRCAVPACSARRNLHDHHLQFRSRSGGNGLENRVTVCAAHHLRGIHSGVIRAWGTAPAGVHWQLGVRSNAPPLLAYVGERVCDAGAG
jgi:hypothetical protein